MAEIKSRSVFQWTFDVIRTEDDDWPDERPMPYSSVGRKYRPERVALSFSRLNMGEPKLDYGTKIYGPRYVKQGAVGAVVDENPYGTIPDEPWLQKIVADCRAQVPEIVLVNGGSNA